MTLDVSRAPYLCRMSKSILAALVVGLAIGVGGCTTPAPDAAPVVDSQSPSPSVVAEPVATAIVLSGTEVKIEFDDDSSETLAYSSDSAPAIAALSEAIGAEPTESKYDTCCLPSHTLTEWDGITVITDYAFLPAGQQFSVTFAASTSGSLALRTVDDVVVGDSLDSSLAAIEGEEHIELKFDGFDFETIAYDSTRESNKYDDWGGFIRLEDDVVVTIASPILYDAMND